MISQMGKGANMSTLPSCDSKIHKHGKLAFIMHSVSPEFIEQFVKKVAAISGQPVDWHYFGGRACVKTTGNVDKVKATILDLEWEYLDEYRRRNGR